MFGLKHFKADHEDWVLLLFDDHGNHFSIDVIAEAHCRYRQPVDFAIYNPFKARCNVTITSWMTDDNLGKTMTICSLSEMTKETFNNANGTKK